MSDSGLDLTPRIAEIADELHQLKEKVVLIYAFNGTGKTRLSVAYKDHTKADNAGNHSGVYYNAFSEDLFTWENEGDFRLNIHPSSLNQFHSELTEEAIRTKLIPYGPKYDFRFKSFEDTEKGIESISFFPVKDGEIIDQPIKISRGEERIFVWCFFLALFDLDAWAGEQAEHFFIDDPVSSLDDHNIFLTANTLFQLIEAQFETRKIIITTHHFGLFSILADWLTKGEKSEKYKKSVKPFLLSLKTGVLTLENPKNDVFLYHLRLLQLLKDAKAEALYTFHFALLRQILENVASFLGCGRFAYVLEKIGVDDPSHVANQINTLSHQKVYQYQPVKMTPDNEDLFVKVFDKLVDTYGFLLH